MFPRGGRAPGAASVRGYLPVPRGCRDRGARQELPRKGVGGCPSPPRSPPRATRNSGGAGGFRGDGPISRAPGYSMPADELVRSQTRPSPRVTVSRGRGRTWVATVLTTCRDPACREYRSHPPLLPSHHPTSHAWRERQNIHTHHRAAPSSIPVLGGCRGGGKEGVKFGVDDNGLLCVCGGGEEGLSPVSVWGGGKATLRGRCWPCWPCSAAR